MDGTRQWKRYALRAAPLVALAVIVIAVNPSLFLSFSSVTSLVQSFRVKVTEPTTTKSSERECNVQNPAKKVAIVGQFFPFIIKPNRIIDMA